MTEMKDVIASNIQTLRKAAGYTQSQLAEELNYSDKAVSKWERGESLPDIVVIKKIADLFKVPVDYLLSSDHSEYKSKHKEYTKLRKRNNTIITALSVGLVWFIATFMFFSFASFAPDINREWLVFVFAIPASMIVLLIFNSIWGKPRLNFLIISILVWTLLGAFYITFLSHNLWLIFTLGIPAQIIIILWSGLKFK